MAFTHLHVHTEYSLLDGSNKIKEYVARVKELGMDSAAITDHGVMYGIIDFYRAAKAAGISRSALYKYKDCVFVHNEALDDKVITLSARLEDRPGVLSGLLNSLSEQQGNILTVNQNIPVDGVAAVSVSARLPLPMDIEQLRQNLLSLSGVTQVDILSTR